MAKEFTVITDNYLPVKTGFTYKTTEQVRYSKSEDFTGIYPDEFKELDDSKETSYVNFDLPTLTIVEDNNGEKIFYPKVVNGNRKYPYYVAIQDNNGSCLPPEFNPDDVRLYEMFGVHFYEKPLVIDIKEALSGCKKYTFYDYCGIGEDEETLEDNKKGKRLCFTTRSINKLKMPGFIIVNILNGINVPKVYINDDRQYIYTDRKTFDDRTNNNLDDYKNIIFERRVFTPEPYKKVYKINNTDIFYYIPFRSNSFEIINVVSDSYTGYEQILNLTEDEFKNGKFYIKNNENYQIVKQYSQGTIYYIKIQLYIRNTIYGEYRPYEIYDIKYGTNVPNKILTYRKNNELLWKEPEVKYGIEIGNEYVDSDGEVIDSIQYVEPEKYIFADNGNFQYIQLTSDETTITADDGYTQESINYSDTDTIGINGNLYFGSRDDAFTFNLGLENEIVEDTSDNNFDATCYLFYYLEDENKKDFMESDLYRDVKINSNYPAMTFQKFCEGDNNIPPLNIKGQEIQSPSLQLEYPIQNVNLIPEGKYSNYPYDWVEKDNFSSGYKFKAQNMPSLFKKSTNLKAYPGYIGKINVNKNELRFKIKGTKFGVMLYGGMTTYPDDAGIPGGKYLEDIPGMYEDNPLDKNTNFRFFAVTDINNKRMVSPLYDQRTIHVSYLHYVCFDDTPQGPHPGKYETFSNFKDKADYYIQGQTDGTKDGHSGQYSKDFIYIWPQRPSKGSYYETNAVYDILEMPNLTNYEFSLSTIFPKKKVVVRYNEEGEKEEVEMDQTNFPDASYNEFWDYDTNSTIKIDLTTLDENSYEEKGYGLAYIEFRDYKETSKYSITDLENYSNAKIGVSNGTYVTFYKEKEVINGRLEPTYCEGWPKEIYYYDIVEDQSEVNADNYMNYYIINYNEETSKNELVKPISYSSEETYYDVKNSYSLTNIFFTRYPKKDFFDKGNNATILSIIKIHYNNLKLFKGEGEGRYSFFTCKARALKINTKLFGDNLILEKWTNFLFKDATNMNKYATTSVYMAVKEMTYDNFLHRDCTS